MRDSSVIEVDAQAALERVFCRAVQAADVPGIARPGIAGAAAGCLTAHGLSGMGQHGGMPTGDYDDPPGSGRTWSRLQP
jgi:hypothetical protein